jgi:hypothetical protein
MASLPQDIGKPDKKDNRSKSYRIFARQFLALFAAHG